MKSPFALLTMMSLSFAACGGAGKATAPWNVAVTGGKTATTAQGTSAIGESKTDRDNDNDNPTSSYYDSDDNAILDYGQSANAGDKRAVTATVKRYYRTASAADGAAACSLIRSTVAESAAESYGETDAPAGKTCADVMSKLFRKRHRQLAAELAALRVTAVRIEGDRGWALLSFGTAKPPGRILMHREGAVWKVGEPVRVEMP
jgi:hypothetical protein